MVTELSPSPPSATKAMIIQLLESTNPYYSDAEIAEKVGRNVGYVRKLKCLNNKNKKPGNRSIVTIQENQSPVHHNAQELATTARQPARRLQAQFSLVNEDRKRVWTMFDEGIKLIEVINDTGHPPQLIENEYEMFLKLKNINLVEIQQTLITKIEKSMDYVKKLTADWQKYCSFVLAEYKRKGYLETQQHLGLEQMLAKIYGIMGKNSIKITSDSAPEGWVRLPCRICGSPLRGLVLDPNDAKGKSILEHFKQRSHVACVEKVQTAKTETAVANR